MKFSRSFVLSTVAATTAALAGTSSTVAAFSHRRPSPLSSSSSSSSSSWSLPRPSRKRSRGHGHALPTKLSAEKNEESHNNHNHNLPTTGGGDAKPPARSTTTALKFQEETKTNGARDGGDGSWNIGGASTQLDEDAKKKKKVAKVRTMNYECIIWKCVRKLQFSSSQNEPIAVFFTIIPSHSHCHSFSHSHCHSRCFLIISPQDALKKLLARQQRDVQQTLDLIRSLDLDDDINDNDNDNERTSSYDVHSNSKHTASHTASSADRLLKTVPTIAASVASGADYGFVSRSEGCRFSTIDKAYLNDPRFDGYGPPGNVFQLGSQQFLRNLRAMFNEYKDEEDNPSLTKRQRELQAKLEELTLDSEAIWARERSRGEIVAPWIIKIPYFVLCYFLDVVFEGKNAFSRFFLLETVARMPYFSYITMLHLVSVTTGWEYRPIVFCCIYRCACQH